ncbi:MAG: retropepsin-like aspartic protease, partial [Bacteroidota bacterium]
PLLPEETAVPTFSMTPFKPFFEAYFWLIEIEYDTGSNGSISMSQKYASKNGLNGVMEKVGTAVSSGSNGEEVTLNMHILPKMQFGGFEVNEVPLFIAEKDPEGVEHNDLLGNNILKRFNAVIDFGRYEIYLKRNTLLDTDY